MNRTYTFLYAMAAVTFASMVFPICSAATATASTISCLNDAYNGFQKSTSDAHKRVMAAMYLGCFPSTFTEFEQLFGFNMKTGVAAPLNAEYPKYLNLPAVNYSYFNKTAFIQKFVAVATTAHAIDSVDAEGELQAIVLIPFRDENAGDALTLLSKYSENAIARFWDFALSSLAGGMDATLYSCPAKFSQTKACRLLADVKKRAPNSNHKICVISGPEDAEQSGTNRNNEGQTRVSKSSCTSARRSRKDENCTAQVELMNRNAREYASGGVS